MSGSGDGSWRCRGAAKPSSDGGESGVIMERSRWRRVAVFGSLMVVTLAIVLAACGSGHPARPGSSSGPSHGGTAKTTVPPHASPTLPGSGASIPPSSSTTTIKPSATTTSVAGSGRPPNGPASGVSPSSPLEPPKGGHPSPHL
jgi:hypothetical protein